MKKTLLSFIGVFAFVAATGLFNHAAAQSVSGSIANGTVARGKTARATVVLSIPAGLHVNSNRPDSEYSVPTTVRASATGVRIGGISYPRGKNRKFSFSEHTINVYDGRAVFGFNVTVPAGFKGSRVAVRVSVKYQACTNEVCYPPTSKTTTLYARVN